MTPSNHPDDRPTRSHSPGIPTPRLHVEGNRLVDPSGSQVTLRGLNVADPKRLNRTAAARGKDAIETVEYLTGGAHGWHPRVIRVPVQPVDVGEHPPGWKAGPPEPPAFTREQLEEYLAEHLDPVVDRCEENGVYCIVDFHRHWHTEDRTQRWDDPALAEEVTLFWETVAPRYADRTHVFYEVYNEPTEPGMRADPREEGAAAELWWNWKAVAQPWVDTIREHAPETPTLIGSPTWSQSPEGVYVERFDGENLAYTYHIYAGHEVSREADWAGVGPDAQGTAGVASEVPLFVTEFGWQVEDDLDLFRASTAEFAAPFREWADANDAIHWMAWCADPVWRPALFDRAFVDAEAADSIGEPYDGPVPDLVGEADATDEAGETAETGENTGAWTLREEGAFVKAWLAERRSDGAPQVAAERTVDDHS
ncbi:glycoside hydrolase family 5 protein [Halococcoides cellulosivorans]|uniref:glycoside hydrolase family 5 protein n=1 Tax=Halococcoides cellulosivorans TaxID=1679096 RepID=UPI00131EE962|nr:cellulase family glycosylhydrolase [Halococcoides cellulosivorans]